MLALAAVAAFALVLVGCGNEAPTPPTLTVAATITIADDKADDPGAAITIDGINTGQITPYAFDNLDVGEYQVGVELDGYVARNESRTVILEYGSKPVADFTLIADMGTIEVTSDPSGAAIFLNRSDTGEVTPFTFVDRPSGTYRIAVELEPYSSIPEFHSVDLTAGGYETAHFDLVQEVGNLDVTSTPAGASILIDGADTGQITPHVFQLEVGDHLVTVQLAGFANPAPQNVSVLVNDTVTADFSLTALSAPRTVLLEGFSNVFCGGCPAMNENIHHVQDQPGYGPERVLYVKWPGSNPSPLDPFHYVTQDITNARVNSYFGNSSVSQPTLQGDGSLLGAIGTPPLTSGIITAIDAQPLESNLLISITPDDDLSDVEILGHTATVELRALAAVDLTDHTLHVVLVYENVHCENTGYEEGIQDFHWVMRDHDMPIADIGSLEAGEATSWPVTLSDPLGSEIDGHAVFPTNKQIIAWVQNNSTKAVIQAGSTVTDVTTQGAATPRSSANHHRHALPGGTR